MNRRKSFAALFLAFFVVFVLPSCSDDTDTQTATEIFADCLERNGVEVNDLEVSLNEDGTVANISASILSEGDVPYEPTVRMACTAEVELKP